MKGIQMKTVAILGNGVVGVELAKGFEALGVRVVFGTRDVKSAKTREALLAVPGSSAASYAEAVRAADTVVVALPWTGLAETLQTAGPDSFAGKLVIDPSNPLDFAEGVPRLAVGFTDSAGETVQRLLPQARVVKAFNIVSSAHMVRPRLADGTPDMFIAGNDEGAKREVGRILEAFGWRSAIDLGDITASRLLEPLAMTWITYAFRHGHWTHAFSLLGRKA
jgi:predicted dinucleotide-binding enzyme